MDEFEQIDYFMGDDKPEFERLSDFKAKPIVLKQFIVKKWRELKKATVIMAPFEKVEVFQWDGSEDQARSFCATFNDYYNHVVYDQIKNVISLEFQKNKTVRIEEGDWFIFYENRKRFYRFGHGLIEIHFEGKPLEKMTANEFGEVWKYLNRFLTKIEN